MDATGDRSRQRELVGVIQNVHEELRYKVQKDPGSYLDIWRVHCDDPVRLEYASAMHTLATKVWASKSNGGDRIEAIKCIIVNYFTGGGSQQVISRMLRKYPPKFEPSQQLFLPPSVPEQELKVLDVGSCYNPFAKYGFDITAVDLCPATPGVFQCDFINVPLGEHLEFHEGSLKCLPSAYFDAVIFCLLLEYLPDPRLRLSAVHKAYQALKENGILVVVTPDSKHQQKNMKMIRSWQEAFSQLGFDRIHYAKHDHIYCLAFRKLCRISRSITGLVNSCGHSFEQMCPCCTEKLSSMLYIHQDKHDYVTRFEPEPFLQRSNEEEREDARLFDELPGILDSDEVFPVK